ncbi:putative RNA-directed DNA polymerase from transposon X-element [Trichonephila clavipes]|nr:putative RNA-directed DNA polymerase from transposon X-element [Trichonephila clavipes]
MSMFFNQILSLGVKELWSLETIGIRDPVENLKERELNFEFIKWFKSPTWLKKDSGNWPITKIDCEVIEVNAERRKVSSMIKRFIVNCRKSPEDRNGGEISNAEFENTEKILVRTVQRECLPEPRNVPIINVVKDNEELLRVKIEIIERKDDPCFLTPILFPTNGASTTPLVEYLQKSNCHACTQILLSIIMGKYWILKLRRTVRQIIIKCAVCRRYSAIPASSVPAALPEDRVWDATVFETTCIDLTGPVSLLNGDKEWIVLFTCAVFGAVHLEIVTSLSTESFSLSLRRFIACRCRPRTIYTDNGTNFRSSVTELRDLDWSKIQRETKLQSIKWKLIPPHRGLWGGW